MTRRQRARGAHYASRPTRPRACFLRAAQVPVAVQNAILGHADGSVGASYGPGLPCEGLAGGGGEGDVLVKSRPVENTLAEFDAALSFCADVLKLKEPLARSRFTTHHRPLLERLCVAQREGADTNAIFNADRSASSIALTEAEELASLLPLLRVSDTNILRQKVETALIGPDIPMEENQNSNRGRNDLFELVMAGKLLVAGYTPILGKHPDLACEVDGRKLLIECKRPSSDGAIRKRLKEAGGQLGRQLKDWRAGTGTRGVVALSLTKVINPGDQFLRYKREGEASRFLGDCLQTVQQECYSTVEALPAKIVGVLWHVITPAIDETANMFVVAQHMLVQGINRTSLHDDAPVKKVYDKLAEVFDWSS